MNNFFTSFYGKMLNIIIDNFANVQICPELLCVKTCIYAIYIEKSLIIIITFIQVFKTFKNFQQSFKQPFLINIWQADNQNIQLLSCLFSRNRGIIKQNKYGLALNKRENSLLFNASQIKPPGNN